MKYIFNGREYKKNGRNNNGLGVLCLDIFKQYLKDNNRTYGELQEIFRDVHKEFSGPRSKKKIIFDKNDFEKWYKDPENNDTKKDERYFGWGKYKQYKIYDKNKKQLFFTTQWGNKREEKMGNIDRMIDFARKQNFKIETVGNEECKSIDYKNDNVNNKITEMITAKNIILYGVPGVGKTYSHKKLIDMIESKRYSDIDIFKNLENHESHNLFDKVKEEERVKFITFHQSFGYEDFIEGFRPNDSGKIELMDGVFKDFCKKAEENKDKNYYFIIDEINRGNISKIFGEIITLIEEDKRDILQVDLPYSKQPFSIPSNIYIIGTMNSTDKSIALIDIALRRRFAFLKMKPNLELIKNEKAKELMKNINDKIEKTLGEDYQIGHSYFMNVSSEDDLKFVINYKIKPLIEEYFYGQADGYREILEIIR